VVREEAVANWTILLLFPVLRRQPDPPGIMRRAKLQKNGGDEDRTAAYGGKEDRNDVDNDDNKDDEIEEDGPTKYITEEQVRMGCKA